MLNLHGAITLRSNTFSNYVSTKLDWTPLSDLQNKIISELRGYHLYFSSSLSPTLPVYQKSLNSMILLYSFVYICLVLRSRLCSNFWLLLIRYGCTVNPSHTTSLKNLSLQEKHQLKIWVKLRKIVVLNIPVSQLLVVCHLINPARACI